MNSRSRRPRTRAATGSDSASILRILESGSFPGSIQLMYTRRPDPMRSFSLEGRKVRVVVGEGPSGEILGFGCASINDCYWGGQAWPTGYLFGFRVGASNMAAITAAPAGYRMMMDDLEADGARLCYTTILADNADGQRFFEKKRSSMPEYEYLGNYTVFVELPRRRSVPLPRGNRFCQASEEDWKEVAAFLNEAGTGMNLFPVIPEKLQVDGSMPPVKDFYFLRDESDAIVAAGALWDQTSYKQYIVTGYSGLLKIIRPVSSVFPLAGYPRLPVSGSSLRLITLSFWAVKDHDPDRYRLFLDGLSARMTKGDLLVVGIFENHPLHRVHENRRGIRYQSRLYSVGETRARSELPIYLECGRL